MNTQQITELGYIDKGTGKHQSNIVYSVGGLTLCIAAGCGVKYWIYVIDRTDGKRKNSKQSD